MIQTSPLASKPEQTAKKEQTIAAILGKNTYQDVDWRALMLGGVLVKLTIRRCRFTTAFDLSDLGITIQDERVRQALSRTLQLGKKRLLPQTYMDQLERIESGARRALKNRSFQTELGAFLPRQSYDSWKAEYDSYRERYFALKEEIVRNYREVTSEVLGEYEVIARDTYERLRAVRPQEITQTEQEFVGRYCNRIATLIPTIEHIEESFDFQMRLRESREQIQALDLEEAEVFASANGNGLRAEAVRLAAEQQDASTSALERDLRRQATQQKRELVDSFLTAVVGQVRTLIYDTMTDVLSTLQKQNGTFSGRSVGRSMMQLKNMVKQLEGLNFYGDREVETILREVQEVIEIDPEQRQRSLRDIEQTMRSIATVTRATLLDLGEEPRSGREVGILDYPPSASLRTARLQLGLDLGVVERQIEATAMRQNRIVAQTLPLWEAVPEREQRLTLRS